MSLADYQAEGGTLAEIFGRFTGISKMYERLGEFICNYAKVEQACHLMFDQMSGLSREVSRAIMGGSTRLADLVSVLTRIVDLSGIEQERKNEYHICIDHLNAITKLRHGLIHRGASLAGEEIRSSNELIARSKDGVEILKLHVDDLKAAAQDLYYMELRLLYVMYPDLKDRLGAFASKIFGPWQFKPVQPDKPFQLPRKVRLAKRPRRSASRP